MIQTLLNNWRTTSAGALTIATAIVNVAFAHKHGVDDQGTWIMCITQVLTGVGLMFAGDQAQSKANHDDTLNQLADIKQAVNTTVDAVKTGDTSVLPRAPLVAQPPKVP